MEKRFIGSQELLEDSFKLAVKVYESGFRPDYIVGLWRGGTPVGIVVHDFFNFMKVKVDHISVRTSYRGREYYDHGNSSKNIRVHATRFLVDRVNAEDKLLIVDDVYGSGRSVKAVVDRLSRRLRANMAGEVRIAVPYCRTADIRTGVRPDYCVHEYDNWLVLPHELNGLSADEIKEHRPTVHNAVLDALGE